MDSSILELSLRKLFCFTILGFPCSSMAHSGARISRRVQWRLVCVYTICHFARYLQWIRGMYTLDTLLSVSIPFNPLQVAHKVANMSRSFHKVTFETSCFITRTRLYNFELRKPHFYIVKLGLQGYTLFFLFLLKNIDCCYSLVPPHRSGSIEYPQSMF